MSNLLDPPSGRTQYESLTNAAFEDHLFIKFPNTNGLCSLPGQKDPISAAIRDGSCIENGNTFYAATRSKPIPGTIPCDSRTELSKLIRGISSGEHIEYAIEDVATQS